MCRGTSTLRPTRRRSKRSSDVETRRGDSAASHPRVGLGSQRRPHTHWLTLRGLRQGHWHPRHRRQDRGAGTGTCHIARCMAPQRRAGPPGGNHPGKEPRREPRPAEVAVRGRQQEGRRCGQVRAAGLARRLQLLTVSDLLQSHRLRQMSVSGFQKSESESEREREAVQAPSRAPRRVSGRCADPANSQLPATLLKAGDGRPWPLHPPAARKQQRLHLRPRTHGNAIHTQP